ncbi:MAG: hydroxyacylglutathione hydrolase, partial [Steroidobacteraceae bacterium]|nr:hydroxyacylglutathione hydrolase [Steroidobacteraceae bacterium]
HVNVTHRRARALRLRRVRGAHWELWLDDGGALRADHVVLATGNPSPACLPGLEQLCGSDVYEPDPWSLGRPGGRDLENVLLVGSGLTMIDAALRLAAVRPRVRRIHVLSRHGLLPHPQVTHATAQRKPEPAPLDEAAGSTRKIMRAFRTLTRETAAAGGDWREVLALARARLPTLWIGLSTLERARFLRHVRSHWDVHRHRVPAGPLAAVRNLERLGVLEVHAGRIVSARAVDGGVEVTWLPRGEKRTRAWIVDRIVNCTGPDARAERSTDPFIASLISAGFVRADALALGLEIAADGRPVGRDGTTVDRLWYLGPWLRARDWEATAVPELRDHAARLAQRILSLTGAAARAP